MGEVDSLMETQRALEDSHGKIENRMQGMAGVDLAQWP